MKTNEKHLVLLRTYKTQNGSCEESNGNGVVIGNKLFTAGHVAGKKTFALTKGKCEELVKCLIKKNDELKLDGEFYDFSVFDWDGAESPLELADEPVKVGDTFTCAYLKHEVKKSDPNNIFRCADGEQAYAENYIAMETEAKVLECQGNFFACEMSEPLKQGNSGCPLIKDGKVYGLLRGGIEPEGKPEENGKICAFVSAAAIRKFITV